MRRSNDIAKKFRSPQLTLGREPIRLSFAAADTSVTRFRPSVHGHRFGGVFERKREKDAGGVRRLFFGNLVGEP
jgi:hypothetical protein